MSNLSIIFAGISLILIILVVTVLMVSKQMKKAPDLKVSQKGKNDFLFISYTFFSEFFITKRYLRRIRKRIQIIELSDNWTINRKTMRFAYIAFTVACVMLIIMLQMDFSLYYFLITIVTIAVIHEQVLKIFIDKIENKLLVQFEEFIGDVRHFYHEHGMVEEAIYEAINESKYEISLHAKKMYDVLTSNDVQESIDQYNDLIQNKYFRIFIALCYMVQKFGDKVVDGKSLYLTNLNYLKQELSLEFLRRKKIDYLFKSLSIIAITPIFFIKIIEKWAISNMPDLTKYYHGSYGMIMQMTIFLIAIICYKLINRMQHSDNQIDMASANIESSLLKVSWIYDLLDNIVTKNYTKTLRIKRMLRLTNNNYGIHNYYLKRLLWATVGFVLCLGVVINVHVVKANNILNDGLIASNEKVKDEAEKSLIRENLDNPNKEHLYDQVQETLKLKDIQIINTVVTEIMSRAAVYQDNYFKWWELLICIAISMIFYWIPHWMIVFRQKVLKMTMEDEVMQFHTIILMLMYVDRITVEDILQWIGQFSLIFKPSINRCINDFEYGDIEALEQLKMDESFMPFIRIVENLQSASDKISILQAFDELKLEREYYQQKRKQDNEMISNKKGAMGKFIAFTPMIITIILYNIVPFLLISISKLGSYSHQIKGL